MGGLLEHLARLFDVVVAFDVFFANVEQAHGGGRQILDGRNQGRAHEGELHQVLGGAIDVGPHVEHRGGLAFGIGHVASNGRAVDAGQGLEHIAGDGHQGARVAG